MQEDDDDFGVTSEDTEILNLPLYTERKADGIYRYRRRVPKALRGRLGKGYLYRNLGRTKQEVVGKWPAAHAEIEQVLETALEGQSKAQELIRKKDHRATILHLVTQEYGTEAAQRLGRVTVSCRSRFSFRLLYVQKPRGFSSLMRNVYGVDCRSH